MNIWTLYVLLMVNYFYYLDRGDLLVLLNLVGVFLILRGIRMLGSRLAMKCLNRYQNQRDVYLKQMPRENLMKIHYSICLLSLGN